jgi:hypothetical protein
VFRQEVVDWARNAGCQIRRIRVGTPRSQPWKEGNSPLESTANKPQNVDSGYVLRMQPLSLLVSGRLTNVKGLLAQLRSTDRLVQSRKLSLHSTREDPNQLVLEIELMLFDLTKAEAPTG